MIPVLASGLGLQVGVNLLTSLAQRVLTPDDAGESFAATLRAATGDGQATTSARTARVSMHARGPAAVAATSNATSVRLASGAYQKIAAS